MRKQHSITAVSESNRGFTLTETLVVLTIFLLLFSLASGLFPHFLKSQEIDQFLRQFSDDVYFAQSYAISHQQYIEVVIDQYPGRSGEKYHVANVMKGKLLERNIPKDVTFTRGSMNLRILFAPNGNISTAGVWNVKTSSSSYKMTFNIGKGRFRIEKL
ncbi:type II secretion system protein [Peribacillus cavernae]|uniref:Type II secretion system protein n=1 Tax=Peribacillus cavernae TaxID=1674310 RepID=A0A3S0TUS6_9BACI|nr:competence type IV pilus minor pilin ComGD [Peribacillus cavernae]MDQ0218333.1 competence protein ComGD [Peribacillus cavernae]RUQ28388.1 type II secretion system protein [Peribacillus cavernae]